MKTANLLPPPSNPEQETHHRVVCIDRMEFNENGDIKPVEMTK